jgi:hypothetical protein
MNILKLVAQLTLDGKGFKAGLREAQSSAHSLSRSIAGSFGAASITAYAKQTVDLASAFHDAAKKANTTAEAFQEEAYWAKLNGASTDDLTRAYKAMAMARDAALNGDAEKMGAFQMFGIGRQELQANTLSQTFRKIAEAARTTDFGTDAGLPILEKVFGKAAQSLLPAFTESLQDAAAEARNLGIILEESVVNNLDNAGDSIDKLAARLRGPFAQVLDAVISKFLKVYDQLDIVVGGGIEYVYAAVNAASQKGSMAEIIKGGLSGEFAKAGLDAMAKHANEVTEKAAEVAISPNQRPRFLGGETAAGGRTVDDGSKALEERIMKYALGKMSEPNRNRALERRAQSLLGKALEIERALDADKAGEMFSESERLIKLKEASRLRRDAIDALGDISRNRNSLDVASLTQSGMFGTGRNSIVSESANPVISKLEKQLGIQQAQLKAAEATLAELKSNPPVRIQR